MAALILPSRWTQQPTSPVDLRDELRQELWGAWVPALYGAQNILTGESGGTHYPRLLGARSEGIALIADGTNAGFYDQPIATPVINSASDTASLLCFFRPTDFSGAIPIVETVSSSFRNWSIDYPTPGAGRIRALIDGTGTDAGPVTNRDDVVENWGPGLAVSVINGTSVEIYFRGATKDEYSSGTWSGTVGGTTFCLGARGDRNGGPAAGSQAEIYWAALSKKAYSAAEIKEIYARGYDWMFRPQVRRIYFDLGAGGGFSDTAMSASGIAAVALASQAIARAALSSAGAASVSHVATAITQSSLSAAGSATVSATGQALYSSAVTSAGVAAASFAGQSVSVSALSSSGTAANAWAGQSLATGALASNGLGAASWTAKSLASSTVTAAGIASASFVALTSGFVDAALSASGVGAFAVAAQSIAQTVVSAAGTGAVSWVSLVSGFADASFVMAGVAAASLAAQAIAQTVASSAGTGTAAFSGQTLKQGALSVSGSATSAWAGNSVAGAVLSAVGAGVSAFVGNAIVQASAYADGVGSVNWVHGNGPVAPALLRITAIRLITAVGARTEISPRLIAKNRLN